MSDQFSKRRIIFLIGVLAAVACLTLVVRRSSKAREHADVSTGAPDAPPAPRADVHMAVGDSAPETPIPGEPETDDAESA